MREKTRADWAIAFGELAVILLVLCAVVIVSTRANTATRKVARDTAAENQRAAEKRARDQRDNSYQGCLRGTRINARSALFARTAQFARLATYRRDGKREDMEAARSYAEIGASAEFDAGLRTPVALPDQSLPSLERVLMDTEAARTKFCLTAYPPL